MSLQKLFLTSVVIAGSMIPAFGQTSFGQTTTSTTTRTSTFTFAPVGLGSTETLQVNIANAAANPTTGSAASCTGTVAFLNASGTAIGTAASFTATLGQIASVKLTSAQAGTGVHGDVRVSITLTLTSGVPCSPSYSLETYDTSNGATHLYESTAGPAQGPGQGFGGR
jgi:hypothetical protein